MQLKQTYTVQEAIQKMEHYCAYQERCHQEVRQKLMTMHMIPEAIDIIIVHLLKHNFLNEERFARAFVRGKFKFKGWGKHRLTHELKQRDINKVTITKALSEISEEEYLETLNELAEKKVLSIRETNKLKKKKKFLDYFLYRGWESHLVYEKANELIQ